MFNKRKNKTFNYKSRFSEDEKSKMELDDEHEITSKWKRTRKTGGKRKIGLPLLLLLFGIIVVVMYYLEYKI